MFGWLKNLFGSEPVQEPVVSVPAPPKVKKVAEKKATKKAAPKVKAAAKTVRKKKEVVTQPVEEIQLKDSAPKKKKGGRPKKASEPAQTAQNSPNS